ncbi:hypothetical protein PR048_001486 [Dryococelus australis]|uniref:Uncharacterized protein n=1 Tax=Dryococelus australis TaxID=614101 RepID=A0ABQ9IHH6_9NEOP|nr:hypothetical protein PR048_001486 [Dryococelus australis]
MFSDLHQNYFIQIKEHA